MPPRGYGPVVMYVVRMPLSECTTLRCVYTWIKQLVGDCLTNVDVRLVSRAASNAAIYKK